jgi:hypothetical protein
VRISKNITFNEAEMAISINIRSFSEKATTLITFIEITEIIEKISDISDTDIADTNIIFENIEDTFSENITVESAPIRKFIRHRKTTFKIIEVNVIAANAVGVAEAPTISADEGESEKENYSSKIIIAKTIITNEDKLTYEEAITSLKEF